MQINDELISCYELVRMAKDRKIDLENTLGKTEVIEGSNITEIAKKMHDYVGSAGRYTAVTKVLSLYTDDSRLKILKSTILPVSTTLSSREVCRLVSFWDSVIWYFYYLLFLNT